MFCIDSIYYRERDVWFVMSAHVCVWFCMWVGECMFWTDVCVCTSINEKHLKGPAGGVCLFDPLRLTAVLCSDAGIKGDYKGIDLATLNRFSFKALPQAPSVFRSPHTHIKLTEQIWLPQEYLWSVSKLLTLKTSYMLWGIQSVVPNKCMKNHIYIFSIS